MLPRYEKLKQKFTDKQWEFLILVNPYGENLSITEICKRLKVNRSSIQDRISAINKKCPGAWYTIKCIKRAMTKERRLIQKLDGGRKLKGSLLNPYELDKEYSNGLTPYYYDGVYRRDKNSTIIFDPFKEVL